MKGSIATTAVFAAVLLVAPLAGAAGGAGDGQTTDAAESPVRSSEDPDGDVLAFYGNGGFTTAECTRFAAAADAGLETTETLPADIGSYDGVILSANEETFDEEQTDRLADYVEQGGIAFALAGYAGFGSGDHVAVMDQLAEDLGTGLGVDADDTGAGFDTAERIGDVGYAHGVDSIR
jgi:hypothetical protein